MSDQRSDIRQIERIVGPFEVVNSALSLSNPHGGGTLDRGIVGHLEDGTRIVIGEVWAACPNENHRRVSIDTDDMVSRIINALNTQEAIS